MSVTSPLQMTITELVNSVAIDDTSLAAIMDSMKTHSTTHATWIGYERICRKRLTEAQKQLKQVTSRMVAMFEKTAKSATAVTNYAKYEVNLHPDVVSASDLVDFYTDQIRFCEEVSRLFSKRADLMVALSRMDKEAMIAAAKEKNVAVRESAQRFNRLMEYLDKPWSKEHI